MKIFFFAFFFLLSLMVMAQEGVKELVRLPAGLKIVEIQTLIEAKKGDDLFVSGMDGKLYRFVSDNNEWAGHSMPGDKVVNGQKFYAGKSGEVALIRDNSEAGTTEIFLSDDGGQHWEKQGELPLSVPGERVASDVDVRSGEIRVVRANRTEDKGQCRVDLLMQSSSNLGKKWDDPVRLNAEPGVCGVEQVPRMPDIVAHDGRLASIWVRNNKLLLDRSFNKGDTWLRNDISIPMYTGLWEWHGQTAGIPKLEIDRSNSSLKNMLYLLWTDRQGEVSQIKMSRSSNFGDIWTPESPLQQQDSTDQLFPGMKVDASLGALYVIYYALQGNKMDVYLGHSLNGGQKFEFRKLNTTSFEPGDITGWVRPCSVTAFKETIVASWIETNQGELVQKVGIFPQQEFFKITK